MAKHLAFLHSVVKKRRTFGNIAIEDESNSFLELQNFDPYEENANRLSNENNDSMQYIDYEYLDSETDTCTDDVPSTEESLQSLSDILSENTLAFVRQQTKSKALNASTLQEPITSNTSTQRLISLNPSTQRPISSNSSTPERSTTPNTSTPEQCTTPNTSTAERLITPERSITPNTSTLEQPITPNTSILKR